ncbi:MAG: Cof-type HAD-IIB family hydrolase [Erysipelotrichaceae bacterium]|nr:Cof-type HAD-IIB family hydrolase [Erysipelotrichaceae bacterium]
MIIFTDVDGTVISYGSVIPPDSEYVAFKKARENGHKIFFVTGRTLGHLEDPIASLGYDGIIGGNGGFIKIGDQYIFEKTMSADDCEAIVNYLYAHNMEFFVESVEGIHGSRDFKRVGAEALKKYGHKSPVIMELYPYMDFPTEWHIPRVTKINYVLNSYQDYLDVKAAFPNFKCLTWGGQGEAVLFGDIATEGIDKSVAIKKTLDYLGVDKSETIGFGDAEVDIPLFKACGTSVCVGNGREAARAAADYVTDAVEDDGIYNAFKHFGLID